MILKRKKCPPALTTVCSSEFLPCYFHWICSTDTTVGFVGLVFKRQQTESPYDKSVTVNETVLTKRTFVMQLFIKNCHRELHENSKHSLVVDVL